ncbi:major capsid protein [Paenibacillus apiarius]|uniref:Major capsid protein n=1 Tax=Paenibacillus apiarius TaxID=46240 RepID=A0ABT4DSG0_9BACL|nr:major capsid protein [Paenibacillus apiarius]MCY9513308.1 major capsid protein [Paenibacillus apiarius]MCY9519720.1 major capsid protein [Paenibacillus apiarius]MCY9553224.1 major capsid protein [Paenibacillus apiarius]MCY9557074.1 major capsid protein [Paenibacillus apiarius]MCY9682185.1 major capsid protein [Paenibacillus apiarius]
MGILSLDQFKQPTFLGYVENRILPKQYLLKAISEFDVTYDMTFDYDVFTQTYAPSAAITGWNAGAPLRDKQGLKTLTQEIAKIQHGIRIDEREQLKFMNPRVNDERERAIKRIYDQTDRLIEGVNDTEEWIRAQAVYIGAIVYSSNDVQIKVDFGLPSIVTAATAWSNRAASNPLDDIRAAIQGFKDANGGQTPSYIDMSGSVLLDITLNEQVRGAIYGVNSAMIPTRAQIESLIVQIADAPVQIRVNDDQISLDGAAASRLLPVRTVALLGEQPIVTVQGPTVEKEFNPGIYVVPKVDMGPPPQEEIYVGESAFVGVKKPSQIYRLSV